MSAGRSASDEHYVLDLCDAVLGVAGSRQHRFAWLRGDASPTTGRSVALPRGRVLGGGMARCRVLRAITVEELGNRRGKIVRDPERDMAVVAERLSGVGSRRSVSGGSI